MNNTVIQKINLIRGFFRSESTPIKYTEMHPIHLDMIELFESATEGAFSSVDKEAWSDNSGKYIRINLSNIQNSGKLFGCIKREIESLAIKGNFIVEIELSPSRDYISIRDASRASNFFDLKSALGSILTSSVSSYSRDI